MNNSNTSTRQPMGFAKILDATFSLYRKHFRLFLGIIALYFCGKLVAVLLGSFLPNFPLKNFVIDLADMPFGLMSIGGIIVATATIYLGKHITSRDALKQAGHRFWQLLACSLVWSLVFVIPRAVDLFPIFYYAGYAESVKGFAEPGYTESLLLRLDLAIFIRLVSLPFSIDLPMAWESVTHGLIPWVTNRGPIWIRFILLVLAPFSIYFAVRWMFVTAAVLFEKPLIRSAFKRSSELTRGRWWWVWGRLVSFCVLSVAISLIVVGMIGFILILTAGTGETMPTDILKWSVIYDTISSNLLFYVIMALISIIIGTFVFPIWVIGITLLYFDLRIRKEGFNIEIQVDDRNTYRLNPSAPQETTPVRGSRC